MSVTVEEAELTTRRPAVRVEGYAPIGAYAAIGDGRTIALVADDGSIDWMPIPGLDDPTVFGALLDPHKCGRFELAPLEPHDVSRRYVDETNVLETTFTTPGGVVTVTDALNLQDGGQLSWVELARSVRAVRGRVRMRYRLRPRFDFGLDRTELTRSESDVVIATQDDRMMAFRCWGAGEPLHSEGEIAGEFELHAELPAELPAELHAELHADPPDEGKAFEHHDGSPRAEGSEALLVCVFAHDQPIPLPPRREIEIRSRRTADAWRRWIDFHSYDGPWSEAVARSLLALKLLIDAHNGAIAAAPTTSLPEWVGGERNYDYRYAWVRDSAFVLDAFGAAGYREQVHASLSFILAATKATHPRLEPFYALDGSVPREQLQLPLAGYRGSRPVHKGNDAEGQLQLGCYGSLLETVELYVRHGNMLDRDTGVRVAEVADHVCRVWHNEDSGIWELFDLHHYTLSKMQCWVALDRAIRLAEGGHAPDGRVSAWREEAQRIREWVDANCWAEGKRSYTFYAGSEDLDAGVLIAARIGYLKPGDPRLRSTVRAIRAELSAGGVCELPGGGPLLYRYSGQKGVEGAFLACSFWLVEALARMGDLEEARKAMDAMLGLSNDVGLYSEEMDPSSGELLGNFPQGLTHLALVNAALAYARARRDQDPHDRRQDDEQS